ncbi:MAG: hypothetical protein IJY65_05675 [Clostridia bacterium]|nr:hypothetical protein [Clostridia bacterium]
MFEMSKWIWPTEESVRNERADFFFEADYHAEEGTAVLNIGCETKYWLFVNGTLVVFDGGLFRESIRGCGYFDSVDITKYLKRGRNEVAIHVWYYGNGGRNNSFCERAGLIVECQALNIFSSENTLCYVDDAYYLPQSEKPSYLYGGDHTAYNSLVRTYSLCPKIDGAHPAKVLGEYGDKPWGLLLERPIPLLLFTDRIPCSATQKGDKYIVDLPYAMHLSPYIRLRAVGGEIIDIRTDRYDVNGGPGDKGRYHGHRAEYVCRNGEQSFEMLDWIFGEHIIFTIPNTVEVIELGYRESGYDAQVTTTFSCNDEDVNKLFSKCVRTLKVCMRENYMDCPDRERGQWIGDVSVQSPQVVYLLDDGGLKLLRKAICDFINLRRGDVLVGNVPGDHSSELPSQSLNAISEWGMIASYYKATGDKSILSMAFEPAVKYLMLWETDEDGVILTRRGGWEWYDHLLNVDRIVLGICWYYSALRFAKFMASELNDESYNDFLAERMKAIEDNFNARYWNTKGFYASGDFVDDRANAMAVLSGLCEKEKYPQLRFPLLSVFNSTPYMENYVLIALCEMGYKADAFRRMMCRYQPLIKNENTTLWEDFFHLGTRNHAWTGGPATVLLRYFAGIQSDLTVEAQNDIFPLTSIRSSFVNRAGDVIDIEISAPSN